MSKLLRNGTNKTHLEDNVSVLVLTGKLFEQRGKQLRQNEDDNEANGQNIDAPAPFLLEVVALADQVQQSKTDIRDLKECMRHQARDNKYSQANITVGKPNAELGYNTDEVLVRMSPIDIVSQHYVPYRTLCMHFPHMPLLFAGQTPGRTLNVPLNTPGLLLASCGRCRIRHSAR